MHVDNILFDNLLECLSRLDPCSQLHETRAQCWSCPPLGRSFTVALRLKAIGNCLAVCLGACPVTVGRDVIYALNVTASERSM